MPLPLDITDLLHGKTVEWERLELKAGWNALDVIQTLSAFANDFHNLGGGYVLIGVAEKDGCAELPPIGLATESLDRIQKEILNLGHNAITHGVVVRKILDHLGLPSEPPILARARVSEELNFDAS